MSLHKTTRRGASFAFCSHGEKLPLQGRLPGVVQRVNRLSKLPPPPPVTPRDSQVLTARVVEFSPNFLCPGGLGFELEEFSTVLKEKCRTPEFVSKKPEAAWKAGVLVLFHINFYKNSGCLLLSLITQAIYCHFDKIFNSSKLVPDHH